MLDESIVRRGGNEVLIYTGQIVTYRVQIGKYYVVVLARYVFLVHTVIMPMLVWLQ